MTFKPSAKTQLGKAHAALAGTDQKRADVRSRRDAALLASDDTGPIIAFDQELAELDRVARAQGDRIEVLKREVEKEEGLARAKRLANLRGRVKSKIAERDAVCADLEKKLGESVKLFRRAHEIGLEAAAMWQWKESDRFAIALAGLELKRLVMNHIFKIGSVVNPLGGLPYNHQEPSFPGGQNPKPTEWALTPDKVSSLVEALAERSAYAARALDGGKIETKRTAAPTTAEEKLSALLNRQAAFALEIGPDSEEKYKAVVREIAIVSAEIKAAQKTKQANMEATT